MSDVFNIGVPEPSGNENDTYVSNDIIYIMKDVSPMMSLWYGI